MSVCRKKMVVCLNAAEIFICQTWIVAAIFASVALLNTNSWASLFIALVGYTRDVMQVLPPWLKLSIIEWSTCNTIRYRFIYLFYYIWLLVLSRKFKKWVILLPRFSWTVSPLLVLGQCCRRLLCSHQLPQTT